MMDRRRFQLTSLAGALAAPLVQRHGRGQSEHTMAILLSALFLFAVTHAEPASAQDRYSAQRARMAAEVAGMARETGAPFTRDRAR